MKFQSSYETIFVKFFVMTLFAAMAIPAGVMAQSAAPANPPAPFHHYKLIEIPTFGGPNSFLSGPEQQVLNDQGTFTVLANTATPNPNASCAIPFNPNDCFVEHAANWHNGTLTDLELLPGGANSQTSAISASGLVAGFSDNGLLDASGMTIGPLDERGKGHRSRGRSRGNLEPRHCYQ